MFFIGAIIVFVIGVTRLVHAITNNNPKRGTIVEKIGYITLMFFVVFSFEFWETQLFLSIIFGVLSLILIICGIYSKRNKVSM
ncbi:hypothetical protein [Priestia megaterium]|uniref:hypothetical protein n=1 Tax=Priestia megaterium TaxID=1404 RepID=UPI0005C43AD1|nr:hypothetical protein [Priestia megaterium]